MYQVPVRILNKIATTQSLKTAWCRKMFQIRSQEALTASLELEADKMIEKGVPLQVVLAYQEIGPLLAEHRAISRFVAEEGDPQLRALLPEILEVDEALEIAQMDRPTLYSHRKQLRDLLSNLPA